MPTISATRVGSYPPPASLSPARVAGPIPMNTKICVGCKRPLQLSDFYRHSLSPDGLRYYCKSCQNAHSTRRLKARRRADKLFWEAEIQRFCLWRYVCIVLLGLLKQRNWRAYQRHWDWLREHPGRASAYSKVAKAVQSGELVRLPCQECGSEPAEAHHEDYDRPLDVLWLCQPHHKRLHREQRDAAHGKRTYASAL